MAVRFAVVLQMSVDQLLRPASSSSVARQPSRKVLRRLEKIEKLPPTQQSVLREKPSTCLSRTPRSIPRART